MSLKINYNIFSALVQKNLTRNTRQLEQAYERISSGERINSAADDPAGLATSEQLRYQMRGLRQNQQNVSSTLSVVGTAETQVGQVITMLQRARELTVQAGNDSLNSQNKQALQQELDQIKDEINRIAQTASYGDRKLFDGTFQSVRLQVGNSNTDFLTLSLDDHRTNLLGTMASITSANPVGGVALSAGQVKINGLNVPASAADGISMVNPAASATAKASAINLVEGQTGVHASVVSATQTGVAAIQAFVLDTVANSLKINGVLIPGTSVSAGDANRNLTTAINQYTDVTGVAAAIDANGVLTLSATDGRNVQVETTGNAAQLLGLSAAAGNQTFSLSGRILLTGSKPFTVEDPAGLIGMGALQQVAGDPASALASADVTSAAGVEKALRTLDAALDQLSAERSRLGVLNNRLTSLNESLARQVEDLSHSDSRIRDTDFALETARMTQAQILQEASIAMLTQANTAPKRALELLQG